jgi:hypothetical protein
LLFFDSDFRQLQVKPIMWQNFKAGSAAAMTRKRVHDRWFAIAGRNAQRQNSNAADGGASIFRFPVSDLGVWIDGTLLGIRLN